MGPQSGVCPFPRPIGMLLAVLETGSLVRKIGLFPVSRLAGWRGSCLGGVGKRMSGTGAEKGGIKCQMLNQSGGTTAVEGPWL